MVTAHSSTRVEGVIPTLCPLYDYKGSFVTVELPRLCCTICSDRTRSQPKCRPTRKCMSAHHPSLSHVLASSQISDCSSPQNSDAVASTFPGRDAQDYLLKSWNVGIFLQ